MNFIFTITFPFYTTKLILLIWSKNFGKQRLKQSS